MDTKRDPGKKFAASGTDVETHAPNPEDAQPENRLSHGEPAMMPKGAADDRFAMPKALSTLTSNLPEEVALLLEEYEATSTPAGMRERVSAFGTAEG